MADVLDCEEEPLLSVAEVAARIGASERFVRDAIRDGNLSVIRLGSGPRRMVRIRPADFHAWLAKAAS
jgi:excisionase family DNA binding protein